GDRRHVPEFAEALGLLAAGLLVGRYGDPASRSQVSGGFALAQWLTTLTGERPTSSTGVISTPAVGRPIRLAETAERRDGTKASPWRSSSWGQQQSRSTPRRRLQGRPRTERENRKKEPNPFRTTETVRTPAVRPTEVTNRSSIRFSFAF